MTQEEKARAYDKALAKAREIHRNEVEKRFDMEWLFPELKESEDEKIRGAIIDHLKDNNLTEWAAWLEKQSKYEIDCPQKHRDNNCPNGCIVLEDFNSGEGFYKVHLDYLNKKQVEEVEEMIRTWNKDSKVPNENIKSCIGMCYECKWFSYNVMGEPICTKDYKCTSSYIEKKCFEIKKKL